MSGASVKGGSGWGVAAHCAEEGSSAGKAARAVSSALVGWRRVSSRSVVQSDGRSNATAEHTECMRTYYVAVAGYCKKGVCEGDQGGVCDHMSRCMGGAISLG